MHNAIIKIATTFNTRKRNYFATHLKPVVRYTTNTIISKGHGYIVGDEVFTRGKKSQMVVCFVDAAFKPATLPITDPAILEAWIYLRFFKNRFTSYLSRFLTRDLNKMLAEVTGEKVNRRAGHGLEIPCVYCLYGPKACVDRMK